jgi:hypothetical protein
MIELNEAESEIVFEVMKKNVWWMIATNDRPILSSGRAPHIDKTAIV